MVHIKLVSKEDAQSHSSDVLLAEVFKGRYDLVPGKTYVHVGDEEPTLSTLRAEGTYEDDLTFRDQVVKPSKLTWKGFEGSTVQESYVLNGRTCSFKQLMILMDRFVTEEQCCQYLKHWDDAFFFVRQSKAHSTLLHLPPMDIHPVSFFTWKGVFYDCEKELVREVAIPYEFKLHIHIVFEPFETASRFFSIFTQICLFDTKDDAIDFKALKTNYEHEKEKQTHAKEFPYAKDERKRKAAEAAKPRRVRVSKKRREEHKELAETLTGEARQRKKEAKEDDDETDDEEEAEEAEEAL